MRQTENAQLSLFGKTCREPSARTAETTSKPSSMKLAEFARASYAFLDLREGGGGLFQAPSWEIASRWPGASWTPNTGECPSVAAESSLSRILEADAPARYCLSPTACLGILRRGTEAREGAAAGAERGAGAAGVWPEVIGPLLARADGSPNIGGGQPFVCAGFMGGQGAKVGGIGYGEDLSPTLKGEASGTNQVPSVLHMRETAGTLRAGAGAPKHESDWESLVLSAYAPSSFGNYREGCGTMKASGGDLGGGSETLVARHAVRRLTPLECERLQGFPDGWTRHGYDGKPISDTQRYKALGNSVAIPCVAYVMGNMARVMEAR